MGVNLFGFDLGFDMPTFAGSNIATYLSIVGVIILGAIFIGVLIYIFYMNKVYYIQIRDFENISGQGFQLVFKDTARLINIGDGGEELIFLKKRKKYRTAYGRKMGKNEYWFAKGQDGYWYNTVLGDLDAKMGMLDIEPIDRDMRYLHVAIRKNIQDRYRKEDKFAKYAPIVMSFIFLIIMVIAVWLLISKVGELITTANQVVESSKPIAETLTKAISKLDNICSQSGLRST